MTDLKYTSRFHSPNESIKQPKKLRSHSVNTKFWNDVWNSSKISENVTFGRVVAGDMANCNVQCTKPMFQI